MAGYVRFGQKWPKWPIASGLGETLMIAELKQGFCSLLVRFSLAAPSLIDLPERTTGELDTSKNRSRQEGDGR